MTSPARASSQTARRAPRSRAPSARNHSRRRSPVNGARWPSARAGKPRSWAVSSATCCSTARRNTRRAPSGSRAAANRAHRRARTGKTHDPPRTRDRRRARDHQADPTVTRSAAPDELPPAAIAAAGQGRSRRVLATCCGAHALHDGYSDLLYVLLPVWQAEFGLALAQIGLLRSIYSGAMAALQVPAGLLAERLGERGLLALGTALAGSAFLLAGWSGSYLALAGCLALGGLGASVQHPLSSALTARAFVGLRLRTALSTYNFSGDVGKMLFPALAAWLVVAWQWRAASQCVGLIGLLAAALLLALLPKADRGNAGASRDGDRSSTMALPVRAARISFVSLLLIGVLDSATRMGFLTLLPFVLSDKGASLPAIGTALTLVFAGGAA